MVPTIMSAKKKAPQSEKIANKPDGEAPDMAYRYKRAFELRLAELTGDAKERVLKPREGDKLVDDFVKEVVSIAESEREL
jgi:hypothetical protein